MAGPYKRPSRSLAVLTALFGANSLQVPIEQLHRIEQTLKKGGKKRVRLLLHQPRMPLGRHPSYRG